MCHGIEMWMEHDVSRDRRAPAAVCPGTHMGKEMVSECCILGSFGCRAVGAALGTVVWGMVSFRATFCGDTVSQGWLRAWASLPAQCPASPAAGGSSLAGAGARGACHKGWVRMGLGSMGHLQVCPRTGGPSGYLPHHPAPRAAPLGTRPLPHILRRGGGYAH